MGAWNAHMSREATKCNNVVSKEWLDSLEELFLSHSYSVSGKSLPVGNVTLHQAANHSGLHVEALHHLGHAHNWGICTREETWVKGQTQRLMRCKETLKWQPATRVCRKWVVLTRNDVGVGDTGQPLEAVALLVFARYLDKEALGGGA